MQYLCLDDSTISIIVFNIIIINIIQLAPALVLKVDGYSVIDDNDLLVITSDSDNDDDDDENHSHAPTSDQTVQDEIPDIWDGFDEGCATTFIAVTSPPQVGYYSKNMLSLT